MNNLSPEDLAWFVGLFEGEGCIHEMRTGYVVLLIASTDEDVLRTVERVVGGGHVRTHTRPSRDNWKQAYTWQLSKQVEVLALLLAMRPRLHERRRNKVDKVLPGIEDRLERRRWCKRGLHLLPADRWCRPCRQEYLRTKAA